MEYESLRRSDRCIDPKSEEDECGAQRNCLVEREDAIVRRRQNTAQRKLRYSNGEDECEVGVYELVEGNEEELVWAAVSGSSCRKRAKLSTWLVGKVSVTKRCTYTALG